MKLLKMKTLFSLLLICVMAGLVACGGAADADKTANDADKAASEMMDKTGITEGDANEAEAQLVDHKCNDKCNADACHKVCGEKGHECVAECHGASKEASLKDHSCNDKCTAEACHTTCGEKGHECSEACHA